jgi:heme-degrading monooxygenase HmoA
MHAIAFRYAVEPDQAERFERTYGPDGDWARFFASAAGYLGTELLRADPGVYLLLDRWESAQSFDAFMAGHGAEYERRSRETSGLYGREDRLGAFELVETAR